MATSSVGRAPGVSWLAWIFHQGVMPELMCRVRWWLERKSVDLFLDDIELINEKIELLGFEAVASELASFLVALFEEHFGEGSEIEPLYIAELLINFDSTLAHSYLRNEEALFIHNWKFDRHMRSRGGALLAFIANLFSPQFFPIDLSYDDIKASVVRNCENGKRSLLQVSKDLNNEGKQLTMPLLLSLVRNDPELILIHRSGEYFVSLVNQLLPTWYLAADLISSSEYMLTEGLGYDSVKYHDVRVICKALILKRFFKFHDSTTSFEGIDDLELCLKQRLAKDTRRVRVQGLPATVREFIICWIKKNNSVWMSSRAMSTLGWRFQFEAGDVKPGRLLVFGNPSNSDRPERLGLVLSEMVSEGIQTKGLIHESRILTPRKEVNIINRTVPILQWIESDSAFRSFGVLSKTNLAKRLLSLNGIDQSAYAIKMAKETLEPLLPEYLRDVGKDLAADVRLYPLIESVNIAQLKRKIVVEQILPAGISKTQFLGALMNPVERKTIASLL